MSGLSETDRRTLRVKVALSEDLGADPVISAAAAIAARAWSEGHAAGRDYAGDGWNSDAHDPETDNPYRPRT